MGLVIYFVTSLDWVTVEGKLNDNFAESRSKGENIAHTAWQGESACSTESSLSRLLSIRERRKKGERE